jgi:CP family cyanate transporter-like MFS transporter
VTSPASRPLWRGRALALVGIALFAFSLRSAVASLSPVLDHIRGDFDVPAWIVGAIGTAPPVCYAIAGLLTPRIERRLGLERFTAVALLVVTAGLVARGLATDAVTLTLATAVIFAGVGSGNILLPPLVKKHFPDRIGLVTTLYSTTMALSTMLPPLFAVPVADAAGWRTSLALWALFSALAILPWVALLLRDGAERRDQAERAAADDAIEPVDTALFGRLWRLPLAWSLMTVFFVSGAFAYTSFAWLPSMLIDLSGVSPAQAGTLLALFATMGLPASLVVPVLVARFRAVPALFAVAIVAGLSGLAGLLFAPAAAPWLWVVLIGTAPLFFPLSLVLIGLRARTHEGALVLSGFVQSIGYAGVALIPLAVGIMHDASGSWTGPMVMLAVVLVAAIPAGFRVARAHTIEDEWEHRHGKPW